MFREHEVSSISCVCSQGPLLWCWRRTVVCHRHRCNLTVVYKLGGDAKRRPGSTAPSAAVKHPMWSRKASRTPRGWIDEHKKTMHILLRTGLQLAASRPFLCKAGFGRAGRSASRSREELPPPPPSCLVVDSHRRYLPNRVGTGRSQA